MLDNGYTDTAGGSTVVHESIAWPFEWYLRDWKTKRWFSKTLPTDATPDRTPVILVMGPNVDPIRNQLGDYVGQKYRLNWWYPEDYKGWTVQSVVDGLRDPETRLKLWRYFLYREPLNPLGSRDFYLYVRSDLARGVVAGGPSITGTAGSAVAPPVGAGDAAPVVAAPPAAAPPGVTGSGLQIIGRTASGAPALSEPKGLARDASGRLYVLEGSAGRVTVFNPDGTVATSFGKTGTGDGEFQEPWGVAVAPNGDVYVADTWNHRIQKFDASGRFLAKWGSFGEVKNPTEQPGVFWGPRAVVIGPDGNVYVTDTGNKRIQVFDQTGRFVRAIGSEGSGPGQFREPVGLAIDASGNLYVADTWNQRIQKLDSAGRQLAQYPVQAWSSQAITNKPYLSVDPTGRIYATVPEERRVLVVETDGRVEPVPQLQGFNLQLPIGVLAGPNDALWVSDSRAGVVLALPPKEVAPPAAAGAPAAPDAAAPAEPAQESEIAP
jgi:streptogramin lyase